MSIVDDATIDKCKRTLDENQMGEYTIPSRGIYPHQWLWDSCFISIGLRHYDVSRAKRELISLKRGAWNNGMLPNIIFHPRFLNFDHLIWHAKGCTDAPNQVHTTGITQPPILAEAVVKIGEKLPAKDRLEWYESMFDCLINYHQWIYNSRDWNKDGLAVLLHPYENGMDNSPEWTQVLNKLKFPWWVRSMDITSIKAIVNHFRRDSNEFTHLSQRIGVRTAMEFLYVFRKLSKNCYAHYRPSKNTKITVVDLAFNCMFIRANQHLVDIAKELGRDLPEDLAMSMKLSERSLDKLYSSKDQKYYSKDYRTGKFIKESGVACLLPLYSRAISKDRAAILTRQLEDKDSFMPAHPIPSAAVNSASFDENRFWQGPTWININWLIIQGLRGYGYNSLADKITKSSLELVNMHGPHEYYSPLDGSPKGANDFSWTASLAIDLQKS